MDGRGLYGVRVEHGYADLGDVRLHYVEAGRGPLVVLLHGFPQFWYMWRHQIPALVRAGFRVVVPDMRGYNLSAKPPRVADYRVEFLARDAERLIRHAGEGPAAVVGHDWGAIVAWFLAMAYPERVERLAVLNVPHPARAPDVLLTPEQLLKSWYVLALQAPGPLGRRVERAIFARFLVDLQRDPSRPGAFTQEDADIYEEAMARPGALTAASNYYRALVRRSPTGVRALLKRIETPTLVIWGEKDRYLSRKLAEPDPRWVPNLRVERLPDASHWVAEDRPEEVNTLLIDFLKASA